jgi:hypothetical protein
MNLASRPTFAERLSDKLFGWPLTDKERDWLAQRRLRNPILTVILLVRTLHALLLPVWFLGVFGLLPWARENFSLGWLTALSLSGALLWWLNELAEARVVRTAIADHEATSPQ